MRVRAYRLLPPLLVGLSNLLRFKFKASTGRNIIKIGKYIIKLYENVDECAYEYEVLTKIALSDPVTFKVPKVYKLFKIQDNSALIMERIAGYYLENYILDFLLHNDPKAVRIFYLLGKAIRELHILDLDGLRSSFLPSSRSELKNKVVELSKKLAASEIIDNRLINAILDDLKKADATSKIFLTVNLHGELYFTHILVQNSKFILLDLHNMQRGPSYFDLAMLAVSLYVSLAFSFFTLKQITPLIEAFLTGYYGKDLDAETFSSMKLAELYVALREILTYARNLYSKSPPAMRLLTTLKIKRLKTAIKEVILPKLTA
jgi:aminoglycoside phosphotransferase